MSSFPGGSVGLIVTSPPYWTAVEYDRISHPWSTYDDYLTDMQSVNNVRECYVLTANFASTRQSC
jgi:hypothetical protein